MAIELFHNHKSTCSQKVRLCLAEKDLPWTNQHIDIGKEENLTPEFLAINPNGVVPALRHNGRNVIESSVIVEYLDEVFSSGAPLTPEDPVDRANMRAWMRFIDEVPSMAVRVPSFQLVIKKRFENMTEEEYQDFVHRNPVRNDFFRRLGRTGFSDAEYEEALERLRRTLQRMENVLQEHDWICGPDYTLAEICLIPTFQRLEDLGLGDMWTPYPNVTAWFERTRDRPSYGAAYYSGSKLFDEDIEES